MIDPTLPPSVAISSELSDDRLQAIASIIAKARRDKLAQRMPQDIAWNLGCDCFIWAWYALREASRTEHRDWLHVPGDHGTLNNMMYVGGPAGVPLKFYNPDVPGQPERTSRPSQREVLWNSEQLLLGDAFFPVEAVKTPEGESVLATAVVRLRVDHRKDKLTVTLELIRGEDEVLYGWPILGHEDTQRLFAPGQPQDDSVELPEPRVELPEEKKAREETEAEERRRRMLGDSDGQKGA